MLYSDNTMQNTAEVAEDLSKCCIKEVEKLPVDRSSAILPMTRLPLQTPQNIQGLITNLSIYKSGSKMSVQKYHRIKILSNRIW